MLAIILAIALAVSLRPTRDDDRRDTSDNEYRNEEGDHLYYDESIIEKKRFHRRFPNVPGIRTFSRLFKKQP